MKLYSSPGPNPRIVHMFAAEKGFKLDVIEINLVGGENRRSPFLAINPAGELPVLLTDTGENIAETTTICEFIEEKYPMPSLIGITSEMRALTRMWTRRIEIHYNQPLSATFRFGKALKLFSARIHCMPHAVDDFATLARQGETWLNGLIGDRKNVVGDHLSLADIVLFCFVDFAVKRADMAPLPTSKNLRRWYDRIRDCDSAIATEAAAYA